ncbi:MULTISPECIES: ABC-2 transporter permease [Bacillus]|uniref:ABC transporter substrate-binding protein n=1 Tax=Bacillus thuringiensis serovar sooncheon TaxID=180891 RepID=A0A9Q5SF03_BACTU|nr:MULTISPECIES: ABC-2 transporter permease [Bacillus]MDC7975870.1 ABC-2 transporter permease [Bacillus sp. BLCC-B18]OTW66136.1 ABC transporter substrate-binding protein [Bacillus thuringiensis serovar coreanensis]OTX43585.1 ABC transporter substrate-binding protein [Bacillus thuringiensis serovar sooncheon]OTX51892.1 ABC transporter substrate-binding protein [Bacillus thuringiensis serovar guiyangiensis]OTX70298.1 ABC transporter substrate-binding protein [Bacillus thuringiensis serovar roski
MQQLILKEFFLQKKMFPFYFLIPILSIFKNSVDPMGIAIGLFITCSTIIYISFYHEEKSKTEKVLVSLPITRKEIVIAKYISSSLFIIAGLSITFIVIILGNILLDRDIVIPGYAVFSAIVATLIYCVVTIPANYIGGYKAITVLNVIMIFPLMGMIGLMCNVFGDKTIMLKVLHSQVATQAMGVLGIGVLVSILVSMFLSMKMFQEAEL